MITVRIQHREGRDEPLARLLALLPPAGTCVQVVTDAEEQPNPWRGYRACLEGLEGDGHCAIIQDDVLVSRNFIPALERIAEANPTTPVSLFFSTLGRRTLQSARMSYKRSRYVVNHSQDIVHVVGILWPHEKAREFLEWVDANPQRLRERAFSSDDATVTRWMKLGHQQFKCSVPNLVEHPDDVPSVVNHDRVKHGEDSGRISAWWIGDGDPLELDWSR